MSIGIIEPTICFYFYFLAFSKLRDSFWLKTLDFDDENPGISKISEISSTFASSKKISDGSIIFSQKNWKGMDLIRSFLQS